MVRPRCRESFAAVGAFVGAGFANGDGKKDGELGFQPQPNPAGDVFGGGVFQAGDVVEETVVKLVFEGFEEGLEVGEVDEPAGAGIDGAFDGDFHAVGVAVEAAALVTRGDVGEAVGGLEGELPGQLDDEGFGLWHTPIITDRDCFGGEAGIGYHHSLVGHLWSRNMTRAELLPEVLRLSAHDQAMIAEAIREHLAKEGPAEDETEFRAELDRRAAQADLHPEEELDFDEVVAELRGRR
jgi:putative addiction module component (TIGR02574 family)